MNKRSESTYFLACDRDGNHFRLPISKERFEALQRAWANLKHFVNIEEEWDAVVQNYVELEKSLLDAALRDMLVSDKDYFNYQANRLQFAVRLSNLLSTCRAYLDHTPHHLGQLTPPQDYGCAFKALRSAEYDGRFGYRLMEALRAYSQHRGLPIHGTRYNSAWVEGGEEEMLRFSVSTHIDLNLLRKDEKFKSSVLQGVTDASVHAEPLVREYLEGLSAVHVGTRSLIDAQFEADSKTVRGAIAEFAAAAPDKSFVLMSAFKIDRSSSKKLQVPLFDDLIKLVERLRRQNRPMVKLGKRFVTNSPEAAKPRKPVKN